MPFITSFSVSLFIGVILVLTKHFHASFTSDSNHGIQKIHTSATPRVGGVAIFIGLLIGWFVAPPNYFGGLFWTLLCAGIPAFLFGVLEDLTKQVSVTVRLLATMSCGIIGYSLTRYSISDVNIYVLDWFMQFTLVSILFTAFAVAGVANALNIIDGCNGLSSGTVLLVSAAFYSVSLDVGDIQVSYVCLLIFSSVSGFLFLNWPVGKLFIGDGGAYFIGFAVAWIAVLLMERHPEISAWAPLLICSYPVQEVLFSMLRRHRRGLKLGQPDRLHMHSLFLRRVISRYLPNASKLSQNSVTGLVVTLFNIPAILIAINWYTDTQVLILGFLFSVFLYSVIYRRLSQFVWRFSPVSMR